MDHRKIIIGSIVIFIIVIVTIALVVGMTPAHAEGNEETTFTLYGIEYVVKEQNITLSPQEVETQLKSYVEYDPELVESIQRALKKKGYSVTIDGKFGPKTGMAVKYFQRKKGLTVDGIVGPDTFKALGITGADEYPRYAPDLYKALEDSPCGKLVHLNLNSHLVEAYEIQDDGVHLLRVMLVATGTMKGSSFTNLCNKRLNRTPTPGGHIGESGWRGEFAVPITAGDYFHSVLAHHKNGKWVLDDNSVLGTNASHGCVRLAVEDAYWLQHFCEKGTAIVVDDRAWDLRP